MKNSIGSGIFALHLVIIGLIGCELEPIPSAIKNKREFYVPQVTDNQWYTLTAAKLAESEHCIVYADIDRNITISVAEAITVEYETRIYPDITRVFGTIADVDGNGKVILLLLDIVDGYTGSGGYVAGYFHPANMYKKSSAYPYSNEADMLYLDVSPLIPGSKNFYVTIAHELEHLINFSNTVTKNGKAQDIWIDEGLATGAEYIYGGDPHERVAYFNADPYQSIRYGNNFFIWNGYWEDPSRAGVYYDSLANYATVYLFFQWLRIHADNGAGIYKEIIDSPHRDYRALTTTAEQRIASDFHNWEILLGNWMLANAYNAPNGFWGYQDKIKTELHALNPAGGRDWGFSPGEGIFSALDKSGEFSPDSDSGPHIRYIGFSQTGSPVYAAPYTGTYLLTFNVNVDQKGGDEKGYLANSVIGDIQNGSESARNAAEVLTAWERPLPASYPLDVRFNLDDASSADPQAPIQAKPDRFK